MSGMMIIVSHWWKSAYIARDWPSINSPISDEVG